MSCAEPASLLEAVDVVLAAAEVHCANILDVRRRLATFAREPRLPRLACPPRCGHLDQALALAALNGAGRLARAIEAGAPLLSWRTYDSYAPGTIGPRFPNAHAFASLVGSDGFIEAAGFELGLFLIAPHTLYRDHRHAAPELYLPVTGPHAWRFAPGAAWTSLAPLLPVWNPPHRVHAIAVGAVPFLALFAWTADVDRPAEVVPASDWASIERPS